MTKIIAFANQKGGVAKTTSAVALSQILSMDDKRVLFLDLDPQENASNTLCLDPDIPSLYDFMTAEEDDRATLDKCFQQVKSCPNITAIRGAIRLSAADMRLNMQGREFILRERLALYLDNYDVVIIDTPPSLGILTINALTCANTVVVPVSPDGYSLQGFHQLTESIRTIKRYSNPQLKTGGILITRYVPNTNVSKAIREIASDYAAMAKTKVYKAVIRQTVSVNESISAQEGLMLFAPNSTAAQDYRAKTRFARFYNLPELIAMFKQIADVQTADMLKLPIPEAEYHNEVIKPSKFQKDMVASFSDRAEKVRNGMVDATVDNMLKITNDGRKLALDQRLTDELLPDDPESKVNLCLDNIHRIWEESKEQRSTQMVFCDLSTPHGDGAFNVYDDLKTKLVALGVPAEEIAFIHDAKTEAQKAALFSNVRSGNVRILLGSTAKMGAGTNVQKRLIAEHHLDIPWRPSDIEQREGRILRQGNENSRVQIYRYVTENTFDSYMWQTIENKQKFISQIMTSKSPVRSCEDVDETALSYAEIKALATGNPHIKEKMDLEIEVSRLKLYKSNFLSQKYSLENRLLKQFPKEIQQVEERIAAFKEDMALLAEHQSEDFPGMEICGTYFAEKKEAGTAIIEACKAQTSQAARDIGKYKGFALLLSFDPLSQQFKLTMRGHLSHTIDLGSDIHGNIQRMDNALEAFPIKLDVCEKQLATLIEQRENAKAEVEKPFMQEEELKTKSARLAELDALLNIDKKENDTLDAEPEQQEEKVIERSEPER